MSDSTNIKTNIDKYRVFISDKIEQDIRTNPLFGSQSETVDKIRDCSSWVLSDGKRLRSMIVLSICNCLNIMTEQNLTATGGALAIEYVHNASLIIDDMPIMDNDSIRRGKSTAHVKWGECIAQIVAYNLIIVAIRHLASNLEALSKVPFLSHGQFAEISHFLYKEFTDKLGLTGLCGGQYLDLHIKENFESLSREGKQVKILDLIERKTGSLFELSFILGWILGGGILERTDEIRDIGRAFGICFQIVDDLADVGQDYKKGNGNNICQYYNRPELSSLFIKNLHKYRDGLDKLELFTPLFKELYNYLVIEYKKHNTIK